MNAKTLAPLVLVILLLSAGSASFSQTGGAPLPPADSPLGELLPVNSSTPMTPEMEAERAKIWNSPAMLRARAWAQEYCQRSAKITPEEGRDYLMELQRMTPTQMKLWLLKFNHEEEMIQQRQAAFEQSRQASVQQALAINRSVQQAYSNINRDENEAAETAEQSINEEQQNAQAGQQLKEGELAAETLRGPGDLNLGLGPYGSGWGPYGNIYGPNGFDTMAPVQYHYHFHY